jgi:hypothetical protein
MAKNSLRWLCKKTCPFYKPRDNEVCGAIRVMEKLITRKKLSVSALKDVLKK